MAPTTAKAKRKRVQPITTKPAGISTRYVDCPSCAKLRKGETPLLVPKGDKQCAHCYGVEWAREWAKKKGKNSAKRFSGPSNRPRAKAKVKKG